MNISNILAGALIAGGLAATSASATSTLNYQGFAHGSTGITWDTGGAGGGALAGAFTMLNKEEMPEETFLAWCIDVLTSLNTGDVEYNLNTPVLTTSQLGRVQKVFDANYEYTPLNGLNSAAFQVAVWDAIYDDDWDASTFGTGVTTGFSILGDTSDPNSVVSTANGFLSAASTYTEGQKWILAQHEVVSPASQDLITVSAIPVPAGVLLIASAFGIAGAVRRRSKARD